MKHELHFFKFIKKQRGIFFFSKSIYFFSELDEPVLLISLKLT